MEVSKLIDFLDKVTHLMDKEDPKGMVIKSLDEEQRQVTGVVLMPDQADLDKDYISKEEVAKACENFNKHCMKANLNHQINVGKEEIEIVKSFVTEIDCSIDGQPVPEGAWLMVSKVHNDEIWKQCKEEGLNAYSIGADGFLEDM